MITNSNSPWRNNRNTEIKRDTEEELDIAIAELVKRGYVLISKHQKQFGKKEYEYKESSKKPNVYKGTQIIKSWHAIMKKGDK